MRNKLKEFIADLLMEHPAQDLLREFEKMVESERQNSINEYHYLKDKIRTYDQIKSLIDDVDHDHHVMDAIKLYSDRIDNNKSIIRKLLQYFK